MSDHDRYRRGLELMQTIQGSEVAAGIRNAFDQISPDFGRYVVEAGFADVYGRPGLTLAQRQLLNVAVLTALGDAEPQLAVHLRGALNVGVSPTEIIEAIFHVVLNAGHPRTVNALRVAAGTRCRRQRALTRRRRGSSPGNRLPKTRWAGRGALGSRGDRRWVHFEIVWGGECGAHRSG